MQMCLSLWLITQLKIFHTVYCLLLSAEKIDECRHFCEEFIKCTSQCMPQYSHRLTTHLLHLADHLQDFGPADCYNIER